MTKMLHLRCLNSLRLISKNIRRIIFVPSKSKSNQNGDLSVKVNLDKVDKDKNSEKVCFEHEDDTIHVVTEKEKDATIKGKLTQECSKLFTGKNVEVIKIAEGFKLAVVDVPKDESKKADKALNKTIVKLKEAIVSETPPPPSGPPPERIGPVRQDPGPVILGFIPREWFTFFIPKTGVTGFGTFLFTTGIFLVSKEYYILEHNYYNGLSVAIICTAVVHYVGPQVAQYLDKELDAYEEKWNKYKKDSLDHFNQCVLDERFGQFQFEGQLLLVDAKRENVALQLENEFRKRQVVVYNEVKRKLDYQAAVGDIHRRIQQKNMVNYVFQEVTADICDRELQDKILNISIENLIHELNKVKKDDGGDPPQGDGPVGECPGV